MSVYIETCQYSHAIGNKIKTVLLILGFSSLENEFEANIPLPRSNSKNFFFSFATEALTYVINIKFNRNVLDIEHIFNISYY